MGTRRRPLAHHARTHSIGRALLSGAADCTGGQNAGRMCLQCAARTPYHHKTYYSIKATNLNNHCAHMSPHRFSHRWQNFKPDKTFLICNLTTRCFFKLNYWGKIVSVVVSHIKNCGLQYVYNQCKMWLLNLNIKIKTCLFGKSQYFKLSTLWL